MQRWWRSVWRARRWRIAGLGVLLVGTGFLAGSGFILAWAQGHRHGSHAHQHGEDTGGWLVRLGADARVRATERQFRGFAPTMAEVAYRYTELYFAGAEGNWDYAAHMIHALEDAVAAGLQRRPQHRKNAEAMFLKATLPPVADAVKRKDPELFKQRVEALRASCTACHAAEGVAFIRIGVPTVRHNPVLNQ
jgi:hypothetical protein